MIATTLLPTLFLSIPVPAAPVAVPVPVVQDEESEARIAEAGDDVAKLEALAATFKEEENDKAARAAFKRILEIDDGHEAAHKALRHHNYDGKWFESYAALSKYRREEAKRMLEEHGKVRFNDEWVLQEDVPYLRMQWVKEGDKWVNPNDIARAKEKAEMEAAGYTQHVDMVWVSPDELPNLEKELYKCGDEWLAIDEANAYHAEIGQGWTVMGGGENDRFLVESTCDLQTSQFAAQWADTTYDALVRAFGVEPDRVPLVLVAKDNAQYNTLASGSQSPPRQPNEIDGFSSLHYAYFADINFDVTSTPPEYRGCGVGFWDTADPNMSVWGPYSIRHAAAHSYIEEIDPSWNAISQFLTSGGGGGASTDAFWREKKIPRWMRYGAASFVERFMEDKFAGDGGDPWGNRTWAIAQIDRQGGLRDLPTIFAFNLDLNDIEGSSKLIHEAGLVMSFILDGGCAPVTEKHEAFKAALKSGEGVAEAVVELQNAVIENEEALYAYSGVSKWEPPAEPEPAPAEAAADTGGADAAAGGADSGGSDDASGSADGGSEG